ncbi:MULTISPECIES: hypothetical protein [Cohnella]|uniref:Uncharacterized protein n=1 Tax=Cohnella phaseoli TaxID=456490 RepID=A0A3D9I177_9BACL|nr:hypothetical protein [Cohnella phaseoli]RED55400.1 hypothetical protein DFP98_14345 [Cohnella phaseoli]
MAGNMLYIPYSILLVVGVIVFAVVIQLKKGKRHTRYFLMVSLPVLVIFLFYFWNSTFNNYVKSYLFPSRAFECEYIEELKNLALPLPERMVFKGKEDACSPFYLAYVSADDFKAFYQEQLSRMERQGEIKNFAYVEREDQYGAEHNGYIAELPTGSKIEIFMRSENNLGIMSIDYER